MAQDRRIIVIIKIYNLLCVIICDNIIKTLIT